MCVRSSNYYFSYWIDIYLIWWFYICINIVMRKIRNTDHWMGSCLHNVCNIYTLLFVRTTINQRTAQNYFAFFLLSIFVHCSADNYPSVYHQNCCLSTSTDYQCCFVFSSLFLWFAQSRTWICNRGTYQNNFFHIVMRQLWTAICSKIHALNPEKPIENNERKRERERQNQKNKKFYSLTMLKIELGFDKKFKLVHIKVNI